jgi:hypothetical protein
MADLCILPFKGIDGVRGGFFLVIGLLSGLNHDIPQTAIVTSRPHNARDALMSSGKDENMYCVPLDNSGRFRSVFIDVTHNSEDVSKLTDLSFWGPKVDYIVNVRM